MEEKVITECKKWGIELLSIPPNSSHLLSPCDQGLFAALKHAYWKYNHSILGLSEFSSRIIHFLRSYESVTGPLWNLSYFAHAGICVDLTREKPLYFDIDLVMNRYSSPKSDATVHDILIPEDSWKHRKRSRKRTKVPIFLSQNEKSKRKKQ
jgi:hypothetical protein